MCVDFFTERSINICWTLFVHHLFRLLNLQRWPLPFSYSLGSSRSLSSNHSLQIGVIRTWSKRKINRFLLSKNIFKINMLGVLWMSVCLLAPKGSFITWLDVATASNWMNVQRKKLEKRQKITTLARALLVTLLYLSLFHCVCVRPAHHFKWYTHPLFEPIKDFIK